MRYHLIDELIQKQKSNRERERKQTLSALKRTLRELSLRYGFSQAYIFGSIVKKEEFRSESDVDIAVFGLKTQYFFSMMAEISRRLEREVDLYQMEQANDRLRRKIELEGVLWNRDD